MLIKTLSVLTAFVISIPLLASAATAAELQQQAQDLQKRTEQFQQKLGTSAAGDRLKYSGVSAFR